MKITPSYFRDTVIKFKPGNEKTEKKDTSVPNITDKVTIGNLNSGKSSTASIFGYSPESIKNEQIKTEMNFESKSDKLERLKNQIATGEYNISSEKVADKMIGTHINDLI